MNHAIDVEQFEQTLANARRALLEARTAAGHWEGELSSSALSTATAVFALSLFDGRARLLPSRRPLEKRGSAGASPSHAEAERLIAVGIDWLVANQNADGGWGDTIKSLSNISTTALCWAAFGTGGARAEHAVAVARAEAWLTARAGGVDPGHLIPAIIERYGKDRTFSVPILTMCALAGRLGEGRDAWRRVPQLPFELAAFPQRWFKWLRLPVVSYALPALIAIGLVRHRHRPTRNPLTRLGRHLAPERALRLLEKIQPTTGGYLEATPLTSFVVMSLIGAGLHDHPVVARGVEFLTRSARPDGSWPIDTNLATWVTTLAVNALAIDPEFERILPEDPRRTIRDWLLDQQYTKEHPYTLADPGGWAWTNLSGGVPDADDTPGALLALKHLGLVDDRTKNAAALGVRWLLDLQNRDGGIPTFCRGWGKLPFDRSSADLTAHTLRAWAAWATDLPADLQAGLYRRARKAISFLGHKTPRSDGSWLPLWFGNQHAPDDENPTYGTARVVLAAESATLLRWKSFWWRPALGNGLVWLVRSQRKDGGWGAGGETPASVEETALAVEALVSSRSFAPEIIDGTGSGKDFDRKQVDIAIDRGVAWLIENTDHGTRFDPTPIGFYFAKLWYFEKLYPLIFTVAALNAVKREWKGESAECSVLSAGYKTRKELPQINTDEHR